MNNKEEGLYTSEDLSNEEYHSDDGYFSSSALKTVLKDPQLFYDKYVKKEPQVKPTANSALELGSYVHSRILEPHRTVEEFAMYPGKVKRGKAFEDFKMRNKGKIILNTGQQELGDKLVDNFNNAEVKFTELGIITPVPDLFTRGQTELSIYKNFIVKDKEHTLPDSINIKTRYDYIDPERHVIIDLKTTAKDTDNLDEMKETVDYLGYDLSAALYVDVAKARFSADFDFYLCFLEKTKNRVKLYRLSADTLERGRDKYLEAIRVIKDLEEHSYENLDKYVTKEDAEDKLVNIDVEEI